MGKKEDQIQKQKERVQSVLALVKKQASFNLKQEKFCNNDCVERFLRSKGDNVKRAAKQLKSCLSWRASIGIDNLVADEFSTELAEGLAYVSGHDHEFRPVMIFRVKQDYHKSHSQKAFTRLLVFTLEVAIQTMSKQIEQFVLVFDASFFKSGSAFLTMLQSTLKIMADYYPGRLHKAFVIDPPSMFFYLWKGMKPFIELSHSIVIVSSTDFEESTFGFNDLASSTNEESLRFDPSKVGSSKVGPSTSSRFSFTVSQNFETIKPWYLTLTDTSTFKVGPTGSNQTTLGPTISSLNARSHSFASPTARDLRANTNKIVRKSFFPSTPLPQKTQKVDTSNICQPRTPKPSFFQSPALFFRKDYHVRRAEKSRESFQPYLKLYRRPYDEMTYCSKMMPPLNGQISSISQPLMKREYISVSYRF